MAKRRGEEKTVDWTEQEMNWIEKWTEKKPGLPFKESCPPEIRRHLEERMRLLRFNERQIEKQSKPSSRI